MFFVTVIGVLQQSVLSPIFMDGLLKIFGEETVYCQFNIFSKTIRSWDYLLSWLMADFKTFIPIVTHVFTKHPKSSSTTITILPDNSALEVMQHEFLQSLTCFINDKTLFGDINNLIVIKINHFTHMFHNCKN